MTPREPLEVETDWRDSLAAIAQLARLPNIFTALADVTMGFLFVRKFQSGDGLGLGLLLAASALLYAAGTTFNDYFDYKLDFEERPERPIPSGLISRRAAGWLGTTWLILGLATAFAAWPLGGTLRSALVALLLAGCILLYDVWMKRTVVGPVAMGACRFFNVLLGMSVLVGPWQVEHWVTAAAIGTYITGVTWLSRTENCRSQRLHLTGALTLMMAGVGLLAVLPSLSDKVDFNQESTLARWHLLLAAMGVLIGWRSVWAILDPRPSIVRGAVGQAILSLIFLDAAACFAVRGIHGAAVFLLFLIPAVFFAQLFRST